MGGYPSRAEFFALGLPARAFARQPLTIAAVDAAADTFLARSHGLADGASGRFEALSNGPPGAPVPALPAGLNASTLYFVRDVDALGSDLFRVAATDGGPAVDLTSAGTPPFAFTLDLGARIDLALDAWSRHADQHLTNYAPPLTSAPLQLRMWVCQLAAFDLAVTQGLGDPEFAKDPTLAARATEAQKKLDELAKGAPLAGLVVDQTPNATDNAARGFGDPLRCWSPPGGYI